MHHAEDSLWWYKILHHQVIQNLVDLDYNASILDLGCGTGGLMSKLKGKGFSNIHGMDASPEAVEFCSKRGLDVISGKLEDVTTHFEKNTFDVVICNDVICYFELSEWKDLFNKISSILKPGGRLIGNLPALKAFNGMHDISVGIVHRTRKKEIRTAMTQNLMIKKVNYWPFLLSPIIFLARFKQRIFMKRFPDAPIKSDVSLPSPIVNFGLWFITYVEQPLSFLMPWGSSVFFVIQKQGEKH